MLKREEIVALTKTTLGLTKSKKAGSQPDVTHYRKEISARKEAHELSAESQEEAEFHELRMRA